MSPFSTPGLVVLDAARLIIGLAGILVGAHQAAWAVRHTTAALGQRLRFAGVSLAVAVLSLSRVQNLGQPITWQFVVAALAIALLCAGSWLARGELPAQNRPPTAPRR